MEAHITAQIYTQLAQTFVKKLGDTHYLSSALPIEIDGQKGELEFSAIIKVGHTGGVHQVTPIWWDITGVVTDFDFEIFEAFIRYESAISRL